MLKSVLITGGSGYLGSYLTRYLIENSDMNLRIFDLKIGDKFERYIQKNSARIEFIKGDVRNQNQVIDATSEVDYIVHLAAITSVPDSIKHPKLTEDVNLLGTRNLLQACANQKVTKFVLASSAAVYGDNQNLPLEEEEAGKFELISPYAESKFANESDLTEAVSANMDKIILRFFNIYGMNNLIEEKSNSVTSIFTNLIKQRQTPTIFGDGTSTRDFIHLSDVSRAILMSLESAQYDGNTQIFNIASGRKTTMLDLIEQLNKSMEIRNQDWKSITPEFREHRGGDILHSQASISKAKEILGWEPKTTLNSGLDEMLE